MVEFYVTESVVTKSKRVSTDPTGRIDSPRRGDVSQRTLIDFEPTPDVGTVRPRVVSHPIKLENKYEEVRVFPFSSSEFQTFLNSSLQELTVEVI